MPARESETVVRRFMEGAYTNPEVHDELVADDYVGHFPPNPTLHGPEDLKRFNAQSVAAFPDVQVTIEDLVRGCRSLDAARHARRRVARWHPRNRQAG